MHQHDRHRLHEEVPADYYESGIRTNVAQRFWHQGRLTTIERLLRTLPPSRVVLDLGCHSGWVTAHLQHWTGAEVHGIDFSERAIVYGRARHPEVSLHQGDLNQPLPFATGSVDLVTACDVLEHVVDVPAVLREVVRVLTPGGHALLAVPSGPLFGLVWSVWTRWWGAVWRDLHLSGFTIGHLEGMVHAAGLTIVKHERRFLGMYHVLLVRRPAQHDALVVHNPIGGGGSARNN